MAEVSLSDKLDHTTSNLRNLSFCSTNPRAVEDWVKSLPIHNVKALTSPVYQALRELVEVSMSPPKLLQCLEAMIPRLVDVIVGLNQLYLGSSISLNLEQRKAAELAHAINTLVVRGYARVLVDGLKREEDIVQVVGRMLEWMRAQSMRCYRLYLPQPKQLWRQINALHMYGESKEILGEYYTPCFESSKKRVSLLNLVLQHVFLNRLYQNPLNAKQSVLLANSLADLADMAKIKTHDVNEACTFVLDINSDKEPEYISQSVSVKQPRYVDVSLVTEIINHRKEDSLQIVKRLGPDLVDQIRQLWSAAPMRKETRYEATGSLDFFVGGYQAFSRVTDGLSLGTFMERYHQEWLDDPMNPVSVSRKSIDPIYYKGKLKDQSATGLALILNEEIDRLDNGELVAYRSPSSSKYTLSVVRRIEFQGKATYSLGMQNILHDPEPCIVQVMHSDGSSSGLMPAFKADLFGKDEATSVILFTNLRLSSQFTLKVFHKNSVVLYKSKKTELVTGFVVAVTYEEVTDEDEQM